MRKFFVGGMLLLAISAANLRGALLFPYLDPIRNTIASNILVLTDGVDLSPEQRRQARFLRQARNSIDRSGRASLVNDVQVLANVSSLLRRVFPEGQLDLLLQTAMEQYRIELVDSALSLADTVSQLPPSSTTSAAANTIADTVALLDSIDTTADINPGNRSLLTAALRLRSVEAALLSPPKSVIRSSQFTARVDGQSFRGSPGSGLSVTYNPASEFLSITAREVAEVPSTIRTITLTLNDVTAGTRTYTLGSPGTGTYATYSEIGPTNSVSFTSISGQAIVRLDPKSGTLSGTFSFEAPDLFRQGAIARVSGGNFSVSLLQR